MARSNFGAIASQRNLIVVSPLVGTLIKRWVAATLKSLEQTVLRAANGTAPDAATVV